MTKMICYKFKKIFREPLNKGATPPRNSPISEGTLNLQASTLDLFRYSLSFFKTPCSLASARTPRGSLGVSPGKPFFQAQVRAAAGHAHRIGHERQGQTERIRSLLHDQAPQARASKRYRRTGNGFTWLNMRKACARSRVPGSARLATRPLPSIRPARPWNNCPDPASSLYTKPDPMVVNCCKQWFGRHERRLFPVQPD